MDSEEVIRNLRLRGASLTVISEEAWSLHARRPRLGGLLRLFPSVTSMETTSHTVSTHVKAHDVFSTLGSFCCG